MESIGKGYMGWKGWVPLPGASTGISSSMPLRRTGEAYEEGSGNNWRYDAGLQRMVNGDEIGSGNGWRYDPALQKMVKGDAPGGTAGGGYSSATPPPGSAPEMDPFSYTPSSPIEKYTAPVYDEGKIAALTQSSAAGAVRGLRSAMQRVAGGSFANPNVKRMTLREALAGYGEGLQSAMSKAGDTARGLYNTEYGTLADTAKVNYQGAVQQKISGDELGANIALTKYKTEADRRNLEYKTLWDNYNAAEGRGIDQQRLALEQQKVDIERAKAANTTSSGGRTSSSSGSGSAQRPTDNSYFETNVNPNPWNGFEYIKPGPTGKTQYALGEGETSFWGGGEYQY